MTSEQASDDPKIGQLLMGRYRIARKLGEGGMGAVYEGKHELIGKRLAIKCLHPQFVTNREVVERFHREANTATAVGNEHIIEVFDVGTFEDGSPFMVMEFLEGKELGSTMDAIGGMPIGRLVHILLQVCEALSAAHGRGIVHRDLKPENIFLIQRGQDKDFVKVLDFGISKMREANEALGRGLTKTGMALGTPYYMPPEQAQGVKDIDERADVYAAGVILFQGLTGRLPFDADSYPALMVKIMTEPAPLVHQFRQDVPAALAAVVQRAMAKDRHQRFQSMQELAKALEPFVDLAHTPVMLRSLRPSGQETTPFAWTNSEDNDERGTTGESPSSPPRALTPSSAPDANSMRWLLVGGGVVAAAIGLGVMLGKGDRNPTTVADTSTRPAELAPEPPAPTPPRPASPAALPVGITNPGKPEEVQIAISAQPDNARIFIDEVEFPNPMDAFRPRSLDPIRIRIEADGYRTIEQLAIFDQDRTLDFELERGSGVKRLAAMKQGQAKVEKAKSPKDGKQARISDEPPAQKQAPAPQAAAPSEKPAPAAPAPAPDDGVYRGPTGNIRNEF